MFDLCSLINIAFPLWIFRPACNVLSSVFFVCIWFCVQNRRAMSSGKSKSVSWYWKVFHIGEIQVSNLNFWLNPSQSDVSPLNYISDGNIIVFIIQSIGSKNNKGNYRHHYHTSVLISNKVFSFPLWRNLSFLVNLSCLYLVKILSGCFNFV